MNIRAPASTKLEERLMDVGKKIDKTRKYSACALMAYCLLNRTLSDANGCFSLCNGDVILKSALKCDSQLALCLVGAYSP